MKILGDNPEKKSYPVVPVRDGIVFPGAEQVLLFGRNKSIVAIDEAMKKDRKVVLLMQKNPDTNEPRPADLYQVGVLASIEKVLKGERGEVSALVRGEARIRVTDLVSTHPVFEATVEYIPETISIGENVEEIEALVRHITGELKKAVNLGKGIEFVFLMNIMSGVPTYEFSNHVAMILDLKTKDRQLLLEENNLVSRLKKEAQFITEEVKVLEIEHSISVKTQKKFDKGMKDAVLREKIKTIEQELGEESREDKEVNELRSKIKKAKMPEEAEEKALKELERLAHMSPYNPESSYVRTYLEVVADLPWSVHSKSEVNIPMAEKILNEDHYGLKKIKERILEYLAVMKLKESNGMKKKVDKHKDNLKRIAKQPTILCFVGPPGVGKTSLGRSIARSMGRKFVKMSLGGIRDEAEIRGHRRTYVGALPGRIIQGIRQAKVNNPVFMLDEIDKIGADYRGDPSAALLEALDPEQNFAFSDHYLETPFDLSDVMFITTANMLDTIPGPLRDRLEIITFSGYTMDEKFNIAKNYLVQKQLEAHGLGKYKIKVENNALKLIALDYTREAGVRELERQIATVFRKIARQVVEKGTKNTLVQSKNVTGYLGPKKYSSQVIEEKDAVGIVNGLAWTPVGGEILLIEVAIMPGKGNLTLTGHLGDVMKESGQAALSYIRSRFGIFGLGSDFYNSIDIHIHVPEGAVPKDGPSAGVAITTAMISALTKVPVNRRVAMTGEITLRGRVLEIGGLKEKVIAAHKAGIKTVLVPNENKKDLEDIPKFIKDDIQFIFVSHLDEVLKKALIFPDGKFNFKKLGIGISPKSQLSVAVN